jgi:DNA-binding NarL/FixJ family response regulator
MRVLIADDHAVVRRGLKQILLDEYGALEVGEAGDAHETLRLAREEPWDIVVLDISMPGRSGIEVLKELRQTRPRLPVLILTTRPEELSLSSNTVSTYRARVLEKMGMKTNAELTHYAISNGLA